MIISSSIKHYYHLAKPGIVYGNSIPLIAAFLYGASGSVSWLQLLMVTVGAAFVIASACVCNNIIEHKTDAKMERTKQRALVTGDVSLRSAKLYAALLLILGFGLLIYSSNQFSVVAAAIGFLSYVLLYTPLKQVTHHSTLIGAVPGAMPPLIGYTAATGTVDIAALLFFLTLLFWQMPHFYAIAIKRRNDYSHAHLPTIVSAKGVNTAMSDSMIYTSLLLMTLVTTLFTLHMSIFFGLIIAATAVWLIMMMQLYNQPEKWAKKVFPISLLMLILWSVLLIIEGFI